MLVRTRYALVRDHKKTETASSSESDGSAASSSVNESSEPQPSDNADDKLAVLSKFFRSAIEEVKEMSNSKNLSDSEEYTEEETEEEESDEEHLYEGKIIIHTGLAIAEFVDQEPAKAKTGLPKIDQKMSNGSLPYTQQEPTPQMSPLHHIAYREYRKIDRHAELHGSVVFGLAEDHSDIDVITKTSLYALKERIDHPNSKFDVIDFLPKLKIPRMIIRHKWHGVKIDIVPAKYCKDSKEKDFKISVLCKVELVREFMRRIRRWHKEHCDILVTKNGYPSSFNLLLTGLFYLQNRPLGSLLSLWPDIEKVDEVKLAGLNLTAEGLFKEWLQFLSYTISNVKVDLNEKQKLSVSSNILPTVYDTWNMFDPATLERICDFRTADIAREIAKLAEDYFKNNKRVEPLSESYPKCETCKLEFETEEEFLKHRNKMHKFKCSNCFAVCWSKESLQNHIDNSHPAKLPCIFTSCKKTFRNEHDRVKHLQTEHLTKTTQYN